MPTLAEVTPVDAAFFEKAGASPGDAAILAAQHEAMAGRRGFDARAEMSVASRDMPQPTPTAPLPLASQSTATAALEAHQADQLKNELGRTFVAPSTPSEYKFPSPLVPMTDEAMTADNQLRTALHSEGLPRFIVETIGDSLATATRSRVNETQAQAQARQSSVRATLEKWYGKDTDSNLALANAMTDRLIDMGGPVAEFVVAATPHLSALDIDVLVQFARHKAGQLR